MASLEQWQEYNQDYLKAIDANMSLYNTLEAMDAVEQDPPRKKISVNDIPEKDKNSYEESKNESKNNCKQKLQHWLNRISDNGEWSYKDAYLGALKRLFEDSNNSDWVVYDGNAYSPEEFFDAVRKWTIKIADIENTVNNATIEWSDNAKVIQEYGWQRYKPLVKRIVF